MPQRHPCGNTLDSSEGSRSECEAYRALSSQCWYVLKAGIGAADEIPPEYGVLLAHENHFEVTRPAERRAMRLPFMTWMALARASAQPPLDEDAQGWLRGTE